MENIKNLLNKYGTTGLVQRLLEKGGLYPIGVILEILERRIITKFNDKKLNYPPLFIIGAPRTGSTILYQCLTRALDLAYINNFMCGMYRSIFIASIISKYLLPTFHQTYNSYQGRTRGWNGPSECGEFWYRWFPRERHFVDYGELSQERKTEIKNTVKTLTHYFDKPIVFKNLNCGQRLRALYEIFPGALFVYCKREPLYTAQSLILQREKKFGNRNQWLSVKPKNYNRLLNLNYPEQIVKQIYYIQKQIEEDLTLFDPDQYIEVWYKEFCRSPNSIVTKVVKLLETNGIYVRIEGDVPTNELHYSAEQKLDQKLFLRLKSIVDSLDW